MQTIAVRPARRSRRDRRAGSTEGGGGLARRSEWPTMTALAPASASISAAISPVLAPDALGWQSCPPIARVFEPRAFSAKAAISVAGGQTSRSALAATAEAHA